LDRRRLVVIPKVAIASLRDSDFVVIHAGLYYPEKSLKTRLCLRGKELLYSLCEEYSIPHRRTGKWIVAQTPEQALYLDKLHAHATALDIPTRFLSREEQLREEPAVHARTAVLESPSTGILNSHALMLHLLAKFQDLDGDIVYQTEVTSLAPRAAGGYNVTVVGHGGETTEIDVGVVVNAAGLYSCQVANILFPMERRITPYYAKGNYFSYAAARPKPRRLIYPCPETNLAGFDSAGGGLT
jgi:L-2-hydroxyglutarate oxidase LhgO